MIAADYPHLNEFLASWFHQDFDIEGSTVADVLARYRDVTPPTERALVIAEVTRFLQAHPHATDTEFKEVFHADVIPSALAGSVEGFLHEMLSALAVS
jgi:hypothetical protein